MSLHTKKKKESKHNTEDSHQIIREQKRKREKKDLLKQIQNKNTHLNNYLECKLIKCSTNRHRLAEWIKKTRPIFMLSIRDPLQI